MAIYSSSAALSSIPESEFLNISTLGGGYSVSSTLFRSDAAIVSIAQNPVHDLALHNNDKRNEAVKKIQIAMRCISTNSEVGLTIPADFIVDGKFGTLTEQAVKNFQALQNIDQSGQVDSLTIRKLDEVLQQGYYDFKSMMYLGDVTNKFAVSETFSEGVYHYKLNYTDKDGSEKSFSYTSSTQDVLEVVNDTDPNYVYVKPSELITDAVNTQLMWSTNRPLVRLSSEVNFTIKNLPNNNYKIPGSTLYTIQDNDTIVSIIEQFYFGGSKQIVDIDQNNQTTTIFTIKDRAPGKNIRMQFYILMAYFFNLDGYSETGIHFDSLNINNNPSISANLFSELEKIYIHKNLAPDNTPSKLPNFYNFLQKIKIHFPAYSLSFATVEPSQDQGEGFSAASTNEYTQESNPLTSNSSTYNVAEISLTSGKTIALPPRHFAEILYFYTTFNPNLMLDGNVLRTVPDVSVGEIYNELTARQAQDPNLFESLWDSIVEFTSDGAQEVAEEILELYNDTLNFFRESYHYLTQALVEYWPRGVGGYAEAGVNITWGIPVATNLEAQFFFWRKVTQSAELTICVAQSAKFFAGVDTGVSLGGGFGIGSKKKTDQLNLGVYSGGDFSVLAGWFVEGTAEYEFPVTQDNCALISMIMGALLTGAGGPVLQLTSFTVVNLLKYFDVVDLNPYQYLNKGKFGLGYEASATADAEIGIRTATGNDPETNDIGDTNNEAAEKKSWYSLNNILRYADIGIGGELSGSLKLIDFEYTANYLPDALQPGTLTRLPDKIELQIGSSVSVSGSFSAQTGPLALLSGIGHAVEELEAVINTLTFDKGFGFYVILKYNCQQNPEFVINGNGSLKLVPDGRELKVGSFSGSTDYTSSGKEVYLYIDIDIFIDLILGDIAFNVENVLNLIKKFQYHNKVGLSFQKDIIDKTKPIRTDPAKILAHVDKAYGSKTSRDLKAYEGFLKQVGVGFGAYFDADVTVKIADSPIAQVITDSVRIALDLVTIWSKYNQSEGPTSANVAALRHDLLVNVYKVFTESVDPELVPENTGEAALYIRQRLQNVWEWFTTYGTIYNSLGYQNSTDEEYRKAYTAELLKYLMTVPAKALNKNDWKREGWIIEVITDYIFRFVKDTIEATIALEGYSGINFSGSVEAALGLKGALGVNAGGGLFDRSVLVKDNNLTFTLDETNVFDALNKFARQVLDEIGYDADLPTTQQDYRQIMNYFFS